MRATKATATARANPIVPGVYASPLNIALIPPNLIKRTLARCIGGVDLPAGGTCCVGLSVLVLREDLGLKRNAL